jgi:hypothetical protein
MDQLLDILVCPFHAPLVYPGRAGLIWAAWPKIEDDIR